MACKYEKRVSALENICFELSKIAQDRYQDMVIKSWLYGDLKEENLAFRTCLIEIAYHNDPDEKAEKARELLEVFTCPKKQ